MTTPRLKGTSSRLRLGSMNACLILLVGAVLAASTGSLQTRGFGVRPPQATAPSDTPQAATRRIDRTQGRRLTDALQPTDVVLEVVDIQPPGLNPPPPPGRSQLEQMTIDASVAAVVTVRSVSGSLTSGGDWINTTVVAELTRVFKSTDGPRTAGQLITFSTSGGTVTIGTQSIRATRLGDSSFSATNTYLVFLQRRGNQLWAYPNEVALIDGQTLVPFSREGRRNFPSSDAETVVNEVSIFARTRG